MLGDLYLLKGFIMPKAEGTTYHKDLTDPQLHEPKGVSSAESGTTYIADGNGSGAWSKMRLKDLQFPQAQVGTIEPLSAQTADRLSLALMTPSGMGSLSDSTTLADSDSNVAILATKINELIEIINALSTSVSVNDTVVYKAVEGLKTTGLLQAEV